MDYLERIVQFLIMKASGSVDISLYHGKMGIVLSLYAYANKTDNQYVEEYAWDLLHDVYDGVNNRMPIGLENGLAGIGYGVTVLSRIGGQGEDLNDVLCEIDKKIMSYDPRRIEDISLRNGLLGILNYLELRKRYGKLLSIDISYQNELYSTLGGMSVAQDHSSIKIIDDLSEPDWPIQEYHDHCLGLDGGMSYCVLKDSLTSFLSDF